MITVDIVCPTGGRWGGIENVIKSWTKHIDPEKINLRIFHMHRGMKYLEGYPKAFCIDREFERADYDYCVQAYELFVKAQGAPDICIATNWPMVSRACAEVREKNGLHMKIVSWIHSTLEIYEQENLGGVKDLLYADAHFAINEQLRQKLLAKDPTARVYMVWNPVELQEMKNYAPKDGTLAYVGRLTYTKRLDIILEALYRAKSNWRLKIIGEGELQDEVEGWIRLLKLEDKVELVGWRENPWEECREISILVMASEYEGFSMTAIEASFIGMTVISTPVEGITDYIREGENGYFFPQENAQGLADILDAIHESRRSVCDPEKCRNSVKNFSEEEYFKRVHHFLDEITDI
jgi:UDP-D-galactose:(glucosyl)LPS alpha-1,6-D-galactosyltransferase